MFWGFFYIIVIFFVFCRLFILELFDIFVKNEGFWVLFLDFIELKFLDMVFRSLFFFNKLFRLFLDILKFESYYYIVNFVLVFIVNWLIFLGFFGLNFWKKEFDWFSVFFCIIGYGEIYGLVVFWVSGGRIGDVRNFYEVDF